jgi:hypothetical protein
MFSELTARRSFALLLLISVLSGCLSANVTLAPGADKIKVTKSPTDVASCVAVGNVDGRNASGLTSDGVRQMQNQTLGVGGNVLLVTSELSQKGIAYRCDAGSGK